MERIKRFGAAHRYFFAVFAFLLFYAFAVVGGLTKDCGVVAMEFHALDFGMGFGSFILPGQIYQWICGAPDPHTLAVYQRILLLAFFAALAALSERVITRAEKKDRRAALTLVFLLLTGPCTFSIYITDLGMPEVYWVYLAALFFLCLAYRPLNWVIAPLCVLALMVNYAAILCVVPFFCILLLYKYTTETGQKNKRMLLGTFFVCVAVSVAAYLYLALRTMPNMKLSFEAFNELMRSRGVTELTYTDSLFYGHYEEDYPPDFYARMVSSPFYTEGETLSALQRLANFAVFRWNMVLLHISRRSPLMLLAPLSVILPVIVLIFRFCFGELKNKSNPALRRFVFFCMPAMFLLCICVAWPLSFDFFKWLNFAFLPLLASFLYVFFREPSQTAAYVRRATSVFSYPLILMYCSVYAFCILSAYY